MQEEERKPKTGPEEIANEAQSSTFVQQVQDRRIPAGKVFAEQAREAGEVPLPQLFVP